MEFPRLLTPTIKKLLPKGKIILLSGPRQVGKTFLSKKLFSQNDFFYLNFDDPDDRAIILEKSWPKDLKIIILDELHKMDKWKLWLKAIYDKGPLKPSIIVTGSARMDTFKKGGDSLAGRHFHFRLYPLILQEIQGLQWNDQDILKRLMEMGGFPEPFIEGDTAYLKLWQKSHIHRIIKDDLLDLEKVRELKKIEILVQLLSQRVGGRISYSSLAKSLEVSSHTIKHWLQILEDLYVVFKVLPFTKDISSSILKSPKYYFFDTARVRGDQGAKLENLMASQLLAQAHFLEDSLGESLNLYFLADKQKHEVDFLIERNDKIDCLIEVKFSRDKISSSLKYFTERLKPKTSFQAVYHLDREKHYDNIKIVSAKKVLNYLFSCYKILILFCFG